MKNKTIKLATVAIIAGAMLSACQTSAQKVEKAEKAALEAQQNLNAAVRDSISEYMQFKKASEEKINSHDKSIAEFKARVAKDKKVNRAKYEKKLAELDKKSSDAKKKLADFKETSKEEWEKFKTEFNHDMDELVNALKNFN
jgi:predicted  nucleic acid-binding Zn-ribbon protein